MSNVFRVRLALDSIAIGLIIACLAYWWLDNLAHELFGTALFALIIVHNVFNRRWYGGVQKGKFDAVRVVNIVTIVCLAVAMLIMLVTSFLISRDLFPFTALSGAFAAREIHMFVAYWVVLITAVHLGTRWPVVMNVCRGMFAISCRNLLRAIILRCTAAVIAVWGMKSCSEMAFGSKLMLTYTLDMWDFSASTIGFFVNYASIVGLFAIMSYYTIIFVRRSGTK